MEREAKSYAEGDIDEHEDDEMTPAELANMQLGSDLFTEADLALLTSFADPPRVDDQTSFIKAKKPKRYVRRATTGQFMINRKSTSASLIAKIGVFTPGHRRRKRAKLAKPRNPSTFRPARG